MEGIEKMVNGMAEKVSTGMDNVFKVMREREMEPLDKLDNAQETVRQLAKVIPVMMIADRSLKMIVESMGEDAVMGASVSMASLFQVMACASIGCVSRNDTDQIRELLLDDKGEPSEHMRLLIKGLHTTLSMDERELAEVKSVAKEAEEKYGK